MRRTWRAFGAVVTIAVGCTIGGARMAAQQPTLEELEKQKKQIDAQRELIEAQTKLIEAQRAQQQATELADAKGAKAISEAQKAAADARKADAEAQTAAFKAMIGDVPASGINGTVETKDKAGATEAALLAGRAVRLAASRIAADLPEGDTKRSLLLYAQGDVPNFTALLTFRAQTSLIKRALEEAQNVSIGANQKAPLPQTEAVPFAGAVGLGLEAASKILGFFRSDYAIGGVQLTLDDSMLLHALAGDETIRKKYTVRLPSQYNAQALTNPADGVLTSLIELARLKDTVAGRVAQHDRAKTHFLAEAAKAPEAQKAPLQANAAVHEQATAAINGAVALYAAFFTKLTAADDKGNVPISTVVREDVIARALDAGADLLVVKLQASGGAYYTKKNLWTFFGGMPFYNMGGVVASYVLLSGKEGAVLRSGVVPIHGGFIKSNEVQGVVEGKADRKK